HGTPAPSSCLPLWRPVSSPSLLNAPAPTALSPLSLHDALPILHPSVCAAATSPSTPSGRSAAKEDARSSTSSPGRCCSSLRCCSDRKSTRLNSSHVKISYAVFCLKKKTNTESDILPPTSHPLAT